MKSGDILLLVLLSSSFPITPIDILRRARGARWPPCAGRRSDNKDNLGVLWQTGFYFWSPWAAMALLVNGDCLWLMWRFAWESGAAVIRAGQSRCASSPPRRSQPWNPSWDALHFGRRRKSNSSFCFLKKKTECALSESGIKTCTALTGPSLKPSPHLPPYFSPAVTPDGLHFTNSYFMEMVGEDGAEPCNNNNDY